MSGQVIGFCIEIHRELGPGLLESVYEEALAHELQAAAVPFERQRVVPVFYKGVLLPCGFRIDHLIGGAIVLELKAVTELLPIHHAQVLTYLRLDRRPLGLRVNFNVSVLRDGIRRVIAENAGRQ